jgi:hypothetical protein
VEYEKISAAKDKSSEIVAFVNSSITQGDNDSMQESSMGVERRGSRRR